MFMTRRKVLVTLASAGASAALVLPVAVPAQAATVDLTAHLHATAAFPHVSGKADYTVHHGVRQFDMFISGIPRLHGQRLTVRVHGQFVGRVLVGPRGRAHLDRHSGVPTMSAGDVVRVRTPAGRLVTSGTLRHDHHHH